MITAKTFRICFTNEAETIHKYWKRILMNISHTHLYIVLLYYLLVTLLISSFI